MWSPQPYYESDNVIFFATELSLRDMSGTMYNLPVLVEELAWVPCVSSKVVSGSLW